jgi:hypothetical protein
MGNPGEVQSNLLKTERIFLLQPLLSYMWIAGTSSLTC